MLTLQRMLTLLLGDNPTKKLDAPQALLILYGLYRLPSYPTPTLDQDNHLLKMFIK